MKKQGVALLVTVDEAGKMLSVGRTTVYALLKAKRLRAIPVGRSRRIVVESVYQYVKGGGHAA